MNTKPENYSDDSIIDLDVISQKINKGFDSIAGFLYRVIVFIKKNIVTLSLLFTLGMVVNYFLENKISTSIPIPTTYKHELTVIQNFNSSDYLYAKIDLLNSKMIQKDEAFFNDIGISNCKIFSNVEIKPIVDIVDINGFISKNQNLDLLKLLIDQEGINKILNDRAISKNYKQHVIKISTNQQIGRKDIITPILNYLNDNPYFDLIKKSVQESINLKIQAHEKSIVKIDELLNNLNNQPSLNKKTVNLDHYPESNNIKSIILAKSLLLEELASKKIELLNSDKIIKENNLILNNRILYSRPPNNENRLKWSYLFIGLFLFGSWLVSFYKKQRAKHNLI